MGVNRSGYYKWKARKGSKNRYEKDREILIELLTEVHKKHRSYGYHRLAAIIKRETGWLFSDNLAHKCCKYAGIKSRCNHYRWKAPREEKKTCPNLIRNNWNASRPLEIVVSDMTVLKLNGNRYEWTYLLDTFNNEIISSHLSSRTGDPKPYYECLKDLRYIRMGLKNIHNLAHFTQKIDVLKLEKEVEKIDKFILEIKQTYL